MITASCIFFAFAVGYFIFGFGSLITMESNKLCYHPRIKTHQIKVEVTNLQMKLQENKQLSFRPKKDQKAEKGRQTKPIGSEM